MPSTVNLTDCLEMWDVGDLAWSHLSQVSSLERRNLGKATQNEVWMYRPLKDDVSICVSIWRRTPFVISSLSRIGCAPYRRWAPVNMRVIDSSEKTVTGRPLSMCLLCRAETYCLTVVTLFDSSSKAIQFARML